MSFVSASSIANLPLFSFVVLISTLLKVVFSKTMVDLKSCDIANSVPNSSLTYNTRSVEEPTVVSRGPLTYANEQLWRNAEVPDLVVW
jgi:hypothetical protein